MSEVYHTHNQAMFFLTNHLKKSRIFLQRFLHHLSFAVYPILLSPLTFKNLLNCSLKVQKYLTQKPASRVIRSSKYVLGGGLKIRPL